MDEQTPPLAVTLVPFGAEHAAHLADAVRDPDVRRFTRVPVPTPPAWAEGYVAQFDSRDRWGWAVLDDAGRFVGYAVTGPVDHEGREVEVGYAVVPGARGRGVATAVLHALSTWALDLGMQRVVALVSTDNAASNRVAAKVGYTREGVLRSVHHRGDDRVDLVCWSLLPGELGPAPPTLGP